MSSFIFDILDKFIEYADAHEVGISVTRTKTKNGERIVAENQTESVSIELKRKGLNQ